MIKIITTAVLHCDQRGCDATYGDVVAVGGEAIRAFAYRDDWRTATVEEGKPPIDLCPSCDDRRRFRANEEHRLVKENRCLHHEIQRLRDGRFTRAELDKIATLMPPDDLAVALLQAKKIVTDREAGEGRVDTEPDPV